MNNIDVEHALIQCETELKDVEKTIHALGVTSAVAPYLTQYAIIRACGAIEIGFKSLISDFCCRRSKKQVKRYIAVQLMKGSANPSHGKIVEILNLFDTDWKTAFKSRMGTDPDKSQLLSSLQSLVDARNEFAHGGSPTLSINDVVKYFNHARRILEHVDLVIA